MTNRGAVSAASHSGSESSLTRALKLGAAPLRILIPSRRKSDRTSEMYRVLVLTSPSRTASSARTRLCFSEVRCAGRYAPAGMPPPMSAHLAGPSSPACAVSRTSGRSSGRPRSPHGRVSPGTSQPARSPLMPRSAHAPSGAFPTPLQIALDLFGSSVPRGPLRSPRQRRSGYSPCERRCLGIGTISTGFDITPGSRAPTLPLYRSTPALTGRRKPMMRRGRLPSLINQPIWPIHVLIVARKS